MTHERKPKRDRESEPVRDNDSGTDEVEEASEESFPASDPPSWSPLHSGSPKKKDDEREGR